MSTGKIHKNGKIDRWCIQVFVLGLKQNRAVRILALQKLDKLGFLRAVNIFRERVIFCLQKNAFSVVKFKCFDERRKK